MFLKEIKGFLKAILLAREGSGKDPSRKAMDSLRKSTDFLEDTNGFRKSTDFLEDTNGFKQARNLVRLPQDVNKFLREMY